MVQSVRTLLAGAFDYAGLFPPAALSFEAAVGEYIQHRAQPEAWMLGRFVCPTARLGELAGHRQAFRDRLRISALLAGGDTADAWRARVAAEAAAIAGFRAEHDDWAGIESCEVRLPDGITPERAEALIDHLAEAFTGAGTSIPMDVFEFPADVRGGAQLELIDAFGAALRRQVAAGVKLPGVSPCLKLRCGGPRPESYPSAREVAAIICRCRDAEVPLKFTAGLHHPIYHHNTPARAWMHGFINVFAAGVLAYALQLAVEDVRGILEEPDPQAFQFGDEILGWSEAEATLGEIRFARAHRVVGVGSCSFAEPVEGLRLLRWI